VSVPNPRDEFTPNELAKLTRPSGPTGRRIRQAVRDGDLFASDYGGTWLRIRWRDFEAWRESTRVQPRKRTPRSTEAQRRVDVILRREEKLSA